MREFCIYLRSKAETMYDQSEDWCFYENDVPNDCDYCPHCYTREDYAADCADLECDEYNLFFDYA